MLQVSQSSVLSADQLLTRSKELDAREQYLVSREELAESQQVDIAAAEQRLVVLGVTIEQREKLATQHSERIAEFDKEEKRRLKAFEATMGSFQSKLDKQQLKYEKATQSLEMVNTAIASRQDYYKEQEKLIEKQAEDGNLQLRGLEYEIIEANQVIKDLKMEKRGLLQDKQLLEEDLEAARASFEPELYRHQEDLNAITKQIELATDKLLGIQAKQNIASKALNSFITKKQIVSAEIDAKLKILTTKEQEVMAKREALRLEREEMDEKRHYQSSAQSLYDL